MDKKMSPRDTVLVMLALGALAGVIEVGGGQLLRDINFPVTSGLLTGLGFFVVAIGMVITGRISAGLGIAFIAILSKQLVVPVLGMNMMCKANSSLAVAMEYGALVGVSGIFSKGLKKGNKSRMLIAGGAAAVAAVGFYFIGMRVAPCAYLLSYNSAAGFVSYMGIEGLSWALFSALLFPAGYALGMAVREDVQTYSERNMISFRMGTFMASAVMLLISGLLTKYYG